ncbi:hypothetical protein OsI_28727 [Oryza sativa Indica Group]|uniref:Uncharacterized protein n=1 Tax=Oryza sativa subsp. indica TaxID=39946 RepID=A2YTS6_ORYSI|nr:hypothetical protein OsI_28727 [Oryza sativa Indica Group]
MSPRRHGGIGDGEAVRAAAREGMESRAKREREGRAAKVEDGDSYGSEWEKNDTAAAPARTRRSAGSGAEEKPVRRTAAAVGKKKDGRGLRSMLFPAAEKGPKSAPAAADPSGRSTIWEEGGGEERGAAVGKKEDGRGGSG